MAELRKISTKSRAFLYRVAIEGGAIGSHPIGIFLPNIFAIQSIYLIPDVDLVSAGAAIVDIGITNGGFIPDNTNQIIDNAVQGVAGDYTDYNLSTWGFGLSPATGATQYPNFNTPAYQNGTAEGFSIGMQVIVTISGAALTDGSFIGIVTYFEFD